MSLWKIAPAVALMAFVGKAAGEADVTVQFVENQRGHTLKAWMGGISFDTFAGQYVHNFTDAEAGFAEDILTANGGSIPREIVTYCTEVGIPLAIDEEEVYKFGTFDDVVPDDSPLAATRAQLIADIFGVFGVLPMQSGISDDLAAAFGLLIWEILYDYNDVDGYASLDITSGTFFARSIDGSPAGGALDQGIIDDFNFIVASIEATPGLGSFDATNPSGATFGITNQFRQDQVFFGPPFIPAPGAVALLGMGGLAFGARRRRA